MKWCIWLGVITSIFEVFEKKMVELNGQKNFFQWWKMQNMDSKSLKAIKSFQTLDLSGVREFTCRFGNGPLGIQFGDGVRKDGESYVEVIEKLPEGQGMGYDELQKGDRVVRIGARPIRGMDFDNVISIIKSEKRPLEITFIHGDNVSEASKKDIVVDSPPGIINASEAPKFSRLRTSIASTPSLSKACT